MNEKKLQFIKKLVVNGCMDISNKNVIFTCVGFLMDDIYDISKLVFVFLFFADGACNVR